MSDEKEIRWVGSAYDDLLAFPDESRRYAGFQQDKGIAEARYRAVVNARKAQK